MGACLIMHTNTATPPGLSTLLGYVEITLYSAVGVGDVGLTVLSIELGT